jgi:class 3 adenylate cyclase/predicted ATPase
MSCDLVGSTALSRALDPEDFRDLIRVYQRCCAKVVGRFGGYATRYLGDGVLAYFGYPQAHEDAAERAVRAGLGVIESLPRAISRRADNVGLGVRVGIATGFVVAGDLDPESSLQENAFVGETPGLAARLQEIARPNTVVIAKGTYSLLGELFESEDLGDLELKGFSEAVRAWHVVRPSQAISRFEAAHRFGLTPLVGREDEVELVYRCWQQAKLGDGQIVLLSGEAGIGKSRIMEVLQARIGAEAHTRLRYQCSTYHANSALYPLITQIRQAARIEREDTAEQRLDKLESLLARSRKQLEQAAPLMAALLSIPSGDRYPPSDMTAKVQKEKLLEVLVEQVAGLAARQPVLMLFEDIHWIDPSSLELLGRAVERARRERLLIVASFRPDFTPPWAGDPQVTVINLSRLNRRQSTVMAERVAGGRTLPAQVLEQIVAKTDGLPLFIEELTKMVLASGLLEERTGRFVLTGPLPPLAIPATLEDSLMARLERLAAAKDVAQLAATLGRAFSHEVLAAVSPLSEGDLQAGLLDLVDAGLLYRRRLFPNSMYEFKHALVQEAAYQSLLKSTRQDYHRRIAQVLEERFLETWQTQPELLAHHFTAAGLPERAIRYWQRAGHLAAERSANIEAIAHFSKGLQELSSLTDTPERARQELALQIGLTGPLIAAKGYGAPEMERTFTRALELCEQVGETSQIFPVMYGRFAFHQVKGQVAKAYELAKEYLRLAQRQDSDFLIMLGHSLLGQSLFHVGEPTLTRVHLEQTIALYDPEQHRPLTFLYGMDVRIAALNYLTLALWQLGFVEQAQARSCEAIGQAQELSHMNSLGAAFTFGAIVQAFTKRWDQARELVDSMLALGTEQEFPIWAAAGRSIRGWALVNEVDADAEAGLAGLEEGMDVLRKLQVGLFMPILHTWLAEAQGLLGCPQTGLASLDEARKTMEMSGEQSFAAEYHRIHGELLLLVANSNQSEAETDFKQALEISQGQSALSLELRAAIGLARLWQGWGNGSQGGDLLGEVLDRFTEGYDAPELSEARNLFKSLT